MEKVLEKITEKGQTRSKGQTRLGKTFSSGKNHSLIFNLYFYSILIYFQNLMVKFIKILEAIPESGSIPDETVRYCERFLEFLIDLEALLPTRRFFNTVLDDCHLVVRCHLSSLVKRDEGKLFAQVSLIFKIISSL